MHAMKFFYGLSLVLLGNLLVFNGLAAKVVNVSLMSDQPQTINIPFGGEVELQIVPVNKISHFNLDKNKNYQQFINSYSIQPDISASGFWRIEEKIKIKHIGSTDLTPILVRIVGYNDKGANREAQLIITLLPKNKIEISKITIITDNKKSSIAPIEFKADLPDGVRLDRVVFENQKSLHATIKGSTIEFNVDEPIGTVWLNSVQDSIKLNMIAYLSNGESQKIDNVTFVKKNTKPGTILPETNTDDPPLILKLIKNNPLATCIVLILMFLLCVVFGILYLKLRKKSRGQENQRINEYEDIKKYLENKVKLLPKLVDTLDAYIKSKGKALTDEFTSILENYPSENGDLRNSDDSGDADFINKLKEKFYPKAQISNALTKVAAIASKEASAGDELVEEVYGFLKVKLGLKEEQSFDAYLNELNQKEAPKTKQDEQQLGEARDRLAEQLVANVKEWGDDPECDIDHMVTWTEEHYAKLTAAFLDEKDQPSFKIKKLTDEVEALTKKIKELKDIEVPGNPESIVTYITPKFPSLYEIENINSSSDDQTKKVYKETFVKILSTWYSNWELEGDEWKIDAAKLEISSMEELSRKELKLLESRIKNYFSTNGQPCPIPELETYKTQLDRIKNLSFPEESTYNTNNAALNQKTYSYLQLLKEHIKNYFDPKENSPTLSPIHKATETFLEAAGILIRDAALENALRSYGLEQAAIDKFPGEAKKLDEIKKLGKANQDLIHKNSSTEDSLSDLTVKYTKLESEKNGVEAEKTVFKNANVDLKNDVANKINELKNKDVELSQKQELIEGKEEELKKKNKELVKTMEELNKKAAELNEEKIFVLEILNPESLATKSIDKETIVKDSKAYKELKSWMKTQIKVFKDNDPGFVINPFEDSRTLYAYYVKEEKILRSNKAMITEASSIIHWVKIIEILEPLNTAVKEILDKRYPGSAFESLLKTMDKDGTNNLAQVLELINNKEKLAEKLSVEPKEIDKITLQQFHEKFLDNFLIDGLDSFNRLYAYSRIATMDSEKYAVIKTEFTRFNINIDLLQNCFKKFDQGIRNYLRVELIVPKLFEEGFQSKEHDVVDSYVLMELSKEFKELRTQLPKYILYDFKSIGLKSYVLTDHKIKPQVMVIS